MTQPAPVFDAVFDGQPLRQFITLQAAMAWAEGLETPTGTISFEGQGIIRYVGLRTHSSRIARPMSRCAHRSTRPRVSTGARRSTRDEASHQTG
jgi:hypothetical protein